jgi:hypothetical protein
MEYLTEEAYSQKVEGLHVNWQNYQERWPYHAKAIEWLKKLEPESVLEIGSLGVRLTDKSQAMDFDERWKIDRSDVEFIHDMREIPWPVGHYDVVVGLRCFHYCGDKLVEVFDEARRVGANLILALPHDFDLSPLPPPDETSERLRSNTVVALKVGSMEIKVETLTGIQASAIVAFSKLGGYGHREKIDRYKEWILSGKWSLFYNGTHPRFINDPLIFLPSGWLLEGKHRIIALSELDPQSTADFWVLRDFTAQEAFDAWMSDLRDSRLPSVNWQPRALPVPPRTISDQDNG